MKMRIVSITGMFDENKPQREPGKLSAEDIDRGYTTDLADNRAEITPEDMDWPRRGFLNRPPSNWDF